mmetsp:Transcript_20959/g.30215  ORF Transcript_20959/g.30215 Transcript_20959/m.30215 type:complete len:121 (-) Transcript_20959:183-545(-)|eukprot:CAMPEP_0185019556 /NCGR_PEP_ID=MMETSP1103-20130426/2177_1 /TAXON_ID=36769 /ORGANISM="Paraphysomonas bandaiensis, Strain Caron Lab Isolate" /LENGTH=120 /DNA_ID=CAMNT_0027549941 /DNA_START=49 /DNA_END=411 /DNA_ORIENTATION=-
MSEPTKFGIFAFEPTTVKTFIIYVIVVLFTLGAVSVLLAPDDAEDFTETSQREESIASPKGKASPSTTRQRKSVGSGKKATPKKQAATTPPKPTEPMMSPSRRSERKRRKPAYFEPGSPM